MTVVSPSGEIHVYQYPQNVFSPTDGHSATLIGNEVWIIGFVRYICERGTKAQVHVLDLTTMRISLRSTTGEDPGWLSHHTVTGVEDDVIEVEYGPKCRARSMVQAGKWTLHTGDLRWERNTDQTIGFEKISMDEASFRGMPGILDFWKASKESFMYSDQAMDDASMNGFVPVLDWWMASGLGCKWTERAMDDASRSGHVEVLGWWKVSGFTCKWTSQGMDDASRKGHVEVLEWWKRSGLTCRYTAMSIIWACVNGHIAVLDWWQASGLSLKLDHPIDEASKHATLRSLRGSKTVSKIYTGQSAQ